MTSALLLSLVLSLLPSTGDCWCHRHHHVSSFRRASSSIEQQKFSRIKSITRWYREDITNGEEPTNEISDPTSEITTASCNNVPVPNDTSASKTTVDSMPINATSNTEATAVDRDSSSTHDATEGLISTMRNSIDAVGAEFVSGTIGDIMSRTRRSGPGPTNETIVGGNDTAISAAIAASDVQKQERQQDRQQQFLPRNGLVTSEKFGLAKAFGIVHPLDRMAATANGNLQRLFSSYYDSPVLVVVDYCRPSTQSSASSTSSSTKVWDRRVHLMVHNITFCTATSHVHVHDIQCQKLVESGQVGIGQLYRHLDVLPDFELHSAGYNHDNAGEGGTVYGNSDQASGGLWRKYTLSCPKYVTCHIHETFIADAWDL